MSRHAIPVHAVRQYAPDPVELDAIIRQLAYKPGWTFMLYDKQRDDDPPAGGATLSIVTHGKDAYHPGVERPIAHLFIVPAATYDRESWVRWVFERVRDVETHEACEHFVLDGVRPFAPRHGPGSDPYTIIQYATDEQRRTSFRGEVKPS